MQSRCLVLLSLLVLVYAQSDIVIDGCYYLNGEVFGCMKATTFECDREWFFQITSPVTNEQDGAFIVADGIVPFDEDFHETFELGNGCQFSLTFFDGVYDTESGIFTVQGDISTQCGASAPQIHRIDDFVVNGPRCGSPGYYELPCPSRARRGFTAPISRDLLVDNFEYYYDIGDVSSMLVVRDECLYLNGEEGHIVAPFFCPAVLLDTCSNTGNGMFTSSAGLTLKLPISVDLTIPEHCITLDATHTFCITPHYITSIDDLTLEGDIAYSIRSVYGSTLAEWASSFEFTFPSCGDSHVSCLPDDWDVSYIYFTSSWFENIVDRASDISTYIPAYWFGSLSSSSWSWHYIWSFSAYAGSPSTFRFSPTTFRFSPSPASPASPSSFESWTSFTHHRSHSRSHSSSSDVNLGVAIGVPISLAVLAIFVVVITFVVIAVLAIRKRIRSQQVAYNQLALDDVTFQ